MAPFLFLGTDTGMTVKIVIAVPPTVVYQQVLLFIDEIKNRMAAELIFRCELDGQGGTGLFAESTVYAAGKVNPEPGSIAAAVLPFCGCH